MTYKSSHKVVDLHTDQIERETFRVEIFSDAVFAIAITLLVLDFKVPDNFSSDQFQSLIHQWPNLLGYILTFSTIGIYWITHHNLFNFIKKTNRTMMLLNLLFLMAVCFLPYPTRLISEHGGQVITAVLYGLTLTIINLLLYFLWLYVSRKHRLIYKNVSDTSIRMFGRKILIATGLYTIGIAVSYVSPHLGTLAYALVACNTISYGWTTKISNAYYTITKKHTPQ